MLGKTLELPEQIQRGMVLGKEFSRKHPLMRPDAVDWIGLGGSAVAGDLITAFGMHPPLVNVRISVRRNPGVYSDPRLVSSYSGNTAESVLAFEQVPSDRIWFAMSSGGKLKELADQARVPHLMLPGGYPPRAAIGFGLGAVLAVLEDVYGFDGTRPLDIDFAALTAEANRYRSLAPAENPALDFARHLVDRTIVVYALQASFSGALGFRFRTQLAENSKVWSHVADLPELAHNEIEALPFLGQVLPTPLVVFLGSWPSTGKLVDPRPSLKIVLDRLGISHLTLDPAELWPGLNRLMRGLKTLQLLDAATVYLALLRATDPFDIPTITEVKMAASPS